MNLPASIYPEFRSALPVLGMVHLLPLPGSPGFEPPVDRILRNALRDARVWIEAGADGLLFENFGDTPFFKDEVPPVTVASMASILTEVRTRLREEPSPRTAAVRRRFDRLVWGVNVLRNDARAALSIAAAVGAQIVRVNVHAGAAVTDQGIIEGRAAETLRERAAWAPGVSIFADIRVKHAVPAGERPIEDEVSELVDRAGADAVLVTGPQTGVPPALRILGQVRRVARAPVWVASGLDQTNVVDYLDSLDGIIVGTSVKKGGRTTGSVVPERARAFIDTVRRRRSAT